MILYTLFHSAAHVPPQNSTELLVAAGPVGSSTSCFTGTPIESTRTGSGYTCSTSCSYSVYSANILPEPEGEGSIFALYTE